MSFRKRELEDDLKDEAATSKNIPERLFSDFTILSLEGKEFPCHRYILSSQSTVMLAMLTTNMKEKQEKQVDLKYSEGVVAHFVEYFYSGKVPRKILESNLVSFLELAGQYDLAPLKLLTEEAAIGMLSAENMLDLYALADLYAAEKLKKAAEFFVKKNREELRDKDLTVYPHSVVNDLVRILI